MNYGRFEQLARLFDGQSPVFNLLDPISFRLRIELPILIDRLNNVAFIDFGGSWYRRLPWLSLPSRYRDRPFGV